MNMIRFRDVIINLDQVAFMEFGTFKAKPCINFRFPVVSRQNPNRELELEAVNVYFETPESRSRAFDSICDRVSVLSLPRTPFDRYLHTKSETDEELIAA